MKFSSVKEMRKALERGDLYSIDDRIYLFIYNDEGSVCEYYIDNRRAVELELECRKLNEYWGALLGWGGCIYDGEMAEDYLTGCLDCDWIYTNTVPEALSASLRGVIISDT